MLFTDYAKFKKDAKLSYNYSSGKEKKFYVIKFKNGDCFKQVTIFEDIGTVSKEKGKTISGYGAWFASENDSIFLTAETINELLREEKVEYIQE